LTVGKLTPKRISKMSLEIFEMFTQGVTLIYPCLTVGKLTPKRISKMSLEIFEMFTQGVTFPSFDFGTLYLRVPIID
jgi:hypothetical protein